MRRIRQEGFDVSSWYPILTDWNPSGRSQGSHLFPIANNLSREIVNLWVDQSYDECRATALVKFIKIALSELRGSWYLFQPAEAGLIPKRYTSTVNSPTR